MTSNNIDSVEKSFSSLFDSISEKEKLLVETRLIMYRFLSEIEKISDSRNISRKALAKMIGTSPSFITQLYQGKKIVNLMTLAKFEKALSIKFKISVLSEDDNSVENITERIRELLPLLNSMTFTPSTAKEKDCLNEIARLRPMVNKAVENHSR